MEDFSNTDIVSFLSGTQGGTKLDTETRPAVWAGFSKRGDTEAVWNR